MGSTNANEAQERMQHGLLGVINDIDKSHLRKIQMKMHRCAAVCCENTSASLEETQACVDRCAKDVRIAQGLVAQEIGHLQKRLESCVFECENSVGSASDSSSQSEYKEAFDRCAIKCFDDSRSNLLSGLLKRLKTSLDATTSK